MGWRVWWTHDGVVRVFLPNVEVAIHGRSTVVTLFCRAVAGVGRLDVYRIASAQAIPVEFMHREH